MRASTRPRGQGQRGATLIELLIVVAIGGLIAAPVATWVISTLQSQDIARNVLRNAVGTGRVGDTFSRDVSSATEVFAGVDHVDSDCDGGGAGVGRVVFSIVPSHSSGRVVYTEGAARGGSGHQSLWRRECDDAGALRAATELFKRIVPGSVGAECLDGGGATGPCNEASDPHPRVRLALIACPVSPIEAASTCDPALGSTEDIELHARRRVTPGYEQYSGQAPIAQIQVSPRVGYRNTDFEFDASASRGIDQPGVQVEWRFPNGDTASDVTTTRRFPTHGDHEVRLRITSADGQVNEAVTRVRVVNRHPRAVAVARETPGGLVFDGSGSSHPDGLTLRYYWSFGNDVPPTEGAVVASPFPADAEGRRRAVLRVVDDDGHSDTATVIVDFGTSPAGPIQIDPAPIPVANKLPLVGSVGPDLEPLPVTFSSEDADPSSNWRVTWRGSGEVVATGAGATFTHTFGPEGHGEYEVARTDAAGTPVGEAVAFRVNGAPRPVIDVTTAAAGSPTSFRGDGSTDPEGDPLSWQWDFGWPGEGDADRDDWTATGPSPLHTFPNAGTYVVALVVTDEDGAATRVERIVRVPGTPSPPPEPSWDGDVVRWGWVPGAEQYRLTVMCTAGAPFTTDVGPMARSAAVPAGFCPGVMNATIQARANGVWSQPSPGVDR